MKTLIIIGLLAYAGYRFFRLNTMLGTESVRAYVFMCGLKANETIDEANRIASYDVINGPTEAIICAKHVVQMYYGGKQTLLLREAFECGMKSRLPYWYQALIGFNEIERRKAIHNKIEK